MLSYVNKLILVPSIKIIGGILKTKNVSLGLHFFINILKCIYSFIYGGLINQMKSIGEMKLNETGVVLKIGGYGALRRRIIDMGITPGAIITMKKLAPFGDPIQINVRGYELSIRKSEAKKIIIEKIRK